MLIDSRSAARLKTRNEILDIMSHVYQLINLSHGDFMTLYSIYMRLQSAVCTDLSEKN